MLKMTIDNEEVLSDNDISIKEEILSPSSTILNNVYPKSWELDKDYTSRFYYPKDYSKLNIQNFSIEPEEAGKTIQVNGSATLNDVDTSKESRVLRILGQTSQTGTPTPSSPIPVNVVSGDNTIDICGKNLANPSDIYDGYPTGNNGGTIGFNPSVNSITYKKCVYVIAGEKYTLSWKPNTPKATGSRDIKIVDNNNIILENFAYFNSNNNRTRTFTPTYSGWVYVALDTNATEVQIEKGNQSTIYEPYIGNSYPITLPSGIELCKIPNTTYQDYIYKDNGVWYLHKEIGKVVLDGSRNWIKSGNTNIDRFVLSGYVDYGDTNCFSNYFENEVYSDTNYTKNQIFLNTYSSTKRIIINYSTVGTTTLEQFKNWLSTHNTIVYYVLATPTNTLITNTTLLEQLDDLESQ